MAEEIKQKKEGIPEDLKDLVIARLDILSPHKRIHIGSVGEFTKDELIERVKIGDEIGQKIAKIEISFLRALTKGTLLEELNLEN
ncbi:MAG: hypothetical protein Q8N62_06385 [Candidatus Omnitrophota bacterium]|nr:hypothetical protein [Candidatus Omnitrophota bacterium]MBU1923820.1 hypothetical protein [Candidatus Omnitrophota bacterium]MDP3042329.1 hypothetical protein [Candidatus Omnitrophota bacterium]